MCKLTSLVSLSAVAPSDYMSLHISVIFLSCQKQKCVSVAINKDEMVEEVESFYLTLERVPGMDRHIIIDQTSSAITIKELTCKQVWDILSDHCMVPGFQEA